MYLGKKKDFFQNKLQVATFAGKLKHLTLLEASGNLAENKGVLQT